MKNVINANATNSVVCPESFIATMLSMFEEMNLDTEFFRFFDYEEALTNIKTTEDSISEDTGLGYLNEYCEANAHIFNSWFFNTEAFAEVYNDLNMEDQEATFFSLVFYIMQYVTHAPDEFVATLKAATEQEPYKAKMLLKAYDEATM